MSTPHENGEALIPQPPMTTAALRAAVAQIAPAYLNQFVDHLDQAAEQAARQSTVAPLQNFLRQWAEFVAIQRYPAGAARLHAVETEVATTTDRAKLNAALAEINKITTAAHQEAAGE
ncbi:hypothetical protein SAMN05421874_110215 [Nonomuraea maritima]|uniref:Uncharacterized protein n=1 Tax=Nonomuraea maritima TaxID=683260 RepID=A0A1G9EBR6_9ACTN|nr:DUF6247 family protein [Nonomuraea maritima]SDK73527.1 hypothetical protein SAMN05421874_110215 [Nonomuraea maritima]